LDELKEFQDTLSSQRISLKDAEEEEKEEVEKVSKDF